MQRNGDSRFPMTSLIIRYYSEVNIRESNINSAVLCGLDAHHERSARPPEGAYIRQAASSRTQRLT
jgi:hypothetical protein